MKNKIFLLSKHFLLYGLSSAMQSFVGLLILPLFTRYINAFDFGVYSLMVFFTSLISSIFYFGTTASLNRFYFDGNTSEIGKKHIITSNLFITIGGAIMQLIISILFVRIVAEWMSINIAYLGDFKLLIIANSLGLISNYFVAVLRVLNKSKLYFLLNTIAALANFATTSILISKYNYGISAPIIGILIANVLLVLIVFFFIKNNFVFIIEYSLLKTCFEFGSNIILIGLCFSFLDWIDRIILERYSNLYAVGIYSFGYRIGIIVYVIFSVPFSMAWSTIRMEKLDMPDYELFTSKVVTIYSIIGWFLVLVIGLFINEILLIVGGKNEYLEAVKIIPTVLSAYLIYGYVSIFDIGIFLSKKMYYYVISFVICIVLNVGLNIWMIPYFGFVAAATNTLITYFIYIILIYTFSNFFIDLKLEIIRLFKIIIPVIIILFCKALFLNYSSIINYSHVLFKLSVILLFVSYLWVSVISKSEKDVVIRKIKVILK